jgi:hypothetical protein
MAARTDVTPSGPDLDCSSFPERFLREEKILISRGWATRRDR